VRHAVAGVHFRIHKQLTNKKTLWQTTTPNAREKQERMDTDRSADTRSTPDSESNTAANHDVLPNSMDPTHAEAKDKLRYHQKHTIIVS
jgi:hypothetical protein